MFVISFNICLFIYFSVKYAIQSNDCDVFVNKQSIYLSISIYLALEKALLEMQVLCMTLLITLLGEIHHYVRTQSLLCYLWLQSCHHLVPLQTPEKPEDIIVVEQFDQSVNKSPFYSCVLGCQAFEQE